MTSKDKLLARFRELSHSDEWYKMTQEQRDEILALVENIAVPKPKCDLFDKNCSMVDWITSHFWVPELKGPMWLAPYQITALNKALSTDENGLYNYSLVLWSDIKKSIKSCIAAAVALRKAFELEWGSVKIVANDLKQARSRSYYYLTRALSLNPAMIKLQEDGDIRVNKYEVILNFNKTRVEAIPVDPRGEAGGNDDWIVWTELWAAKSDAHKTMWTEMVVPPAKMGHGIKWCESYAGFSGASPLLEPIHDEVVVPENRMSDKFPVYTKGRTFVLWNQKPKLPWQTEEYYNQQATELDAAEFRRVHRNMWSKAKQQFVHNTWWESCAEELPPLNDNENIVLGVDASVSGDSFAVVGVTRHPLDKTKYAVRLCEVWKPPKNQKLIFSHPKEDININLPDGYIIDLCKRFRVKMIAYDPYQLHSMATRHNQGRLSAWWEEFTQSSRRLEADSQLKNAIKDGLIVHPNFSILNEHIANSDSTSTQDSKLRIVKRAKSKKIDAAVALSMALYTAKKYQI